ncbi:MAG: serine protease [Puniceicoccaceae bacterium]|nr:MAG: serine protease [Puniceicoccaceae bacterium]
MNDSYHIARWLSVLSVSVSLFGVVAAQGFIDEITEEPQGAAVEPVEIDKEQVNIPTGALIVVEGAEGGGGSGFIAKLQDRLFFVTNIHVLAKARGAKFRTADGHSLVLPDHAFLNMSRDLAIIPIDWSGEYLKVSSSLAFDGVKIGDAITVMGNSDGVGVATRLEGRINGIGPEQLQISAKFVPGNSGSPIVHDARGTVVGIVSHMRDLSRRDKWTEDSELSDIRRFGYRLDGENQWEQSSLRRVFDQGELLARYEERTQMMARTIYMLNNERTIMTGYRQHESLGHLFAPFDQGFKWDRGLASANNVRKLERFVNGLRSELVTDRSSTRNALEINFFKKRLLELDAIRDFCEGQLRQTRF